MNLIKIISKLFLYIFFILFFQNLVYSIGVYDSKGDFSYYINNEKPNINLNISSPVEDITITNATFSINGIEQIKIYNYLLNAGNNKIFSFNSSKNITKDSTNLFELLAYGPDGKKIIPQGNPTKFKVIFDNEKPNLISNTNNEYKLYDGFSQIIDFNFNEELLSYKIYINDIESTIDSNSQISIFKKDFKKKLKIDFSSKLNEGKNIIRFEIKDLAENNNTIEFIVSYKAIPINAKLLTRKDDANLKYFYNPNYADFFEKTIYSTTDTYNLVVETTKEAKCYLSDSRIGWGTFEEISNGGSETMKLFTSTNNGKKHSIPVSTNSKIWVACQNPSFKEDIIYLNDILNVGENLINLKKDSGSKFSFIKTFPNSLLSTKKFDVLIETNKRGICSYKLDSRAEEKIISSNNKKHVKANISINDGNHNINFNCFDVLGDIILKKQEFDVDSKNGVKIFPDKLYTNSPSLEANFELSENIECKYSTNSDLKNDDFNSLKNLTGTEFSRSFTATGLINGINSYYIRCDKNGNINVNELKIIYDLNGPVLSNLKFINNGVKSDVLGNTSKINFEFNVTSLTPIKKYFIEFVRNNDSLFFNVTSNQISMNLNISTFKKLKIIAQNIDGKKSKILEKSIRFDLEKPQIDIIVDGDKFKITCIDIGTSCDKIYYGLSKTNTNCKPKIIGDLNSSININQNYYTCIKAYDLVGNMEEKIISLGLNFKNEDKDEDKNKGDEDEEILENKTIIEEEILNETESNLVDDPFSGNDFSNNESKSGTNFVLVAAIFMLIAGVSGGGYYAYNKGYLNEQLKKLGIKSLPSKNKNHSQNNEITKPLNFGKKQKNEEKLKDKKKVSKSNYDNHLDKLNDFIDEKINKGNEVFDKFDDGKHKGNVKGYDDTLINIKKDKSNVSKEEFDDFYSSSKDINLNSNTNIEKESEDFENYYNKKKNLDKKPKEKKK